MLLLVAPSSPSPLAPVVDRAVAAHEADPHSQKGRALEGYRLRFGHPAVEMPHRPASGGDWTLTETIDEIERRGVGLVQSSRGLRVRHANRLLDVTRNVARHERALTTWLSLRQRPVPAPFGAEEWESAVRLQAAWFALDFDAPPTPFALRPGEMCVDVEQLREGIAGRLQAGPLATSAVRLRSELAVLFEAFAPQVQTAPVVVARRFAA